MQPTDERPVGAVQAELLVDLDKHVLGAILGGGHISQRSMGHLKNHAVVAFNQLPESVRVASEAGRDQLLIALGRRPDRLARTHEPTRWLGLRSGPHSVTAPVAA
jgi:hypothetical protein